MSTACWKGQMDVRKRSDEKEHGGRRWDFITSSYEGIHSAEMSTHPARMYTVAHWQTIHRHCRKNRVWLFSFTSKEFQCAIRFHSFVLSSVFLVRQWARHVCVCLDTLCHVSCPHWVSQTYLDFTSKDNSVAKGEIWTSLIVNPRLKVHSKILWSWFRRLGWQRAAVEEGLKCS